MEKWPGSGALTRGTEAMWRPLSVARADLRTPEPHGTSVFAKEVVYLKEGGCRG